MDVIPVPEERLHFAFGPVQEFVSQARRTRDLWAGSFLLAYLAGKAIAAISDTARIVLPQVDPELISWLRGDAGASPPLYAALPNRFTAEGENLEECGAKAARALEAAWVGLAEAVWKHVGTALASVGHASAVQEIWERQIHMQWSVMWAVGSQPYVLEQRKNLRSFGPHVESGEKCTQCGQRQALAPKVDATRPQVRQFWRKFANRLNKLPAVGRVEFRTDGSERLCAICTVKRLYPVVAAHVLGGGFTTNYPSTDFLAAIPALTQLLRQAKEDPDLLVELRKLRDICHHAGVGETEDGPSMPAIRAALEGIEELEPLTRFNGSIWHESTLQQELVAPEIIGRPAAQILAQLRRVKRQAGINISPFYCVLVMDGDSMGRLLSQFQGHEGRISEPLREFTRRVVALQQHPDFAGRVIYAGGDDVLMLVPMTDGLRWADHLRRAYNKAFGGIKATISAALVYAHFKLPLQTVIADAHALLDNVAKDAMGRNAFAARVWRRSGPVLTFARQWESNALWSANRSWIEHLERLVAAVRAGDYSSGFLYRVPELLKYLGVRQIFPGDKQLELFTKLFTMEYLRRRDITTAAKVDKDTAQARVRDLLDLIVWPTGLQGELRFLAGSPSIDGVLLVRFLAQEGRWGES